MTGLILELRRGLGRWLAVPLAVLGVVAAENALPSGTAIWSLSVSALSNSVQLTGPVAAAVAAFAGARSRRRGTETMELLAARTPSAAGVSELAALALWVLVAFLGTVAVVFTQTALSATWSGPDLPRTAITGLGLLLQVAFGYVAGRLIPRRLTPLIVAVFFYVLVVYGSTSRSGYRWSLLLPVNLNLYDFFTRVNQTVTAGQLLWYSGVAAVAVAGWGLRREATRALLGTLAVGMLAATCGAAVILDQNGRALQPGFVVDWQCAGHAPQICIHPAVSAARPALTAQIEPIAARLAGTPFALSRLEQRPRGPGSIPSPGAVAFGLDDTRPESVRLAEQDVAVNAFGFRDTCFTGTGPKDGYFLAQLLASWALGDISSFIPGTPAETAAQAWLASRTDSQRRAWLTSKQATIRNCDLTASNFA
jgi:hypothetical protein